MDNWAVDFLVQLAVGLVVPTILGFLAWVNPRVKLFFRRNWRAVISIGVISWAVVSLLSGIFLALGIRASTDTIRSMATQSAQSNTALAAQIATDVAGSNAQTAQLVATELAKTTTDSAQATTTSALTSTNLLKNSGFEIDINSGDWEWNERSEAVWADGQAGRGICLVQQIEYTEEHYANLSQGFDIVPGAEYQFDGWLKWINARTFHVKLDWYTRDWQYISSSHVTNYLNNSSEQWIKVSDTATAPIEARHAILTVLQQLNDKPNPIGSTICVDELVVSGG